MPINSDVIMPLPRSIARQLVLCPVPGFKAIYLPAAMGGACAWNAFDMREFYAVNPRWPREGAPVFTNCFATWNAAHFLYLSEAGWHHGVAPCVFYPLRASLIGLTLPNGWDAGPISTQRPINSLW